MPVVEGQPYDILAPLAAHFLGGIKFLPDTTLGTTHSTTKLEKTSAAMSMRSAASRAVASLEKRGLLAYGWQFPPAAGATMRALC